jgi:hypothetical protein
MLAIFNPDVKQPPGGFCISVFLISTRDSSTLVGKIANPTKWSERWGLDLKHSERWENKWQLPATYLEIGESPLQTAERISSDQLGIANARLTNPRFFASSGPSSVRPGTIHNDLLFAYDLDFEGDLRTENFRELHYEANSTLSKLEFGRGHDEVLHLCKVY